MQQTGPSIASGAAELIVDRVDAADVTVEQAAHYGQQMSLVTVDAINAFIEAEFPGVGNCCEAVGDRWAIAASNVSPTNLRPGDIISGPTVFGLCDAAFYYACFTAIGLEPMVLTSELSIRFLRPARGHELRARADLHHVGRRSIIATVIAWTTDQTKPVAVAQGTYIRPTAPTI